MRTTIRMRDPLLAEAKRYAAETGQSLTSIIEDAVAETLARRKTPRKQTRRKFTTFGSRGLRHAINVDRSAELRDAMDGL